MYYHNNTDIVRLSTQHRRQAIAKPVNQHLHFACACPSLPARPEIFTAVTFEQQYYYVYRAHESVQQS